MPYPNDPVNPQAFDVATMSAKCYSGSPRYAGKRLTINGGREIFVVDENTHAVTKSLKRS